MRNVLSSVVPIPVPRVGRRQVRVSFLCCRCRPENEQLNPLLSYIFLSPSRRSRHVPSGTRGFLPCPRLHTSSGSCFCRHPVQKAFPSCPPSGASHITVCPRSASRLVPSTKPVENWMLWFPFARFLTSWPELDCATLPSIVFTLLSGCPFFNAASSLSTFDFTSSSCCSTHRIRDLILVAKVILPFESPLLPFLVLASPLAL